MMETAKKARLTEGEEVKEEGSPPRPNMEELHPLLNPVVLDVLFSHCGLEQLKALRLVSRLYYDKSLKHWLQLGGTVVRIRAFSQIEEISKILSADDAEYPGWPHHTKYALTSVPLWVGDWSRMEHFWNQAAQWMTHLTLTDCTFQDHHTLRNVLFCVYTPVLESLRVGYRLRGRIGSILVRTFMKDQLEFLNTLNAETRLRMEDYRFNVEENAARQALAGGEGMEEGMPWNWPHLNEHYRQLELEQREKKADKALFPKLTRLWIETEHMHGRDVPFCWVELLSQYPNLETFHLYIKPEEEDELQVFDIRYDSERDGLNRALRALVALREADRARLQLTEFGLICPKSASMEPHPNYDLFRRAACPLRTLVIKVLPSSTPEEFSNTLRIRSTVPITSLSLVADSPAAGLSVEGGFQVPVMDSVVELTVRGNIFTDMRFLRSFPNLGKLSLVGISGLERVMDCGEAWADGMLLDELKELKVVDNANAVIVPLNAPGVANFRKICQNLKVLELPLSNESFQKVCEHWPNLEQLSFSISEAKLVTMTKGIGKLKDLRHLEIRINSFSTTETDDDASPGMTIIDDLILQGILELKQLQFLSLAFPQESSSASKISEETMTSLRKAVGTVRISPAEGMDVK